MALTPSPPTPDRAAELRKLLLAATPMKMAPTSRGFLRSEFIDRYGAPCSIQESSLAEEAAIWLGCEHETIHSATGEKCGARMHLTQEHVAALLPSLIHFALNGTLPVDAGVSNPLSALLSERDALRAALEKIIAATEDGDEMAAVEMAHAALNPETTT